MITRPSCPILVQSPLLTSVLITRSVNVDPLPNHEAKETRINPIFIHCRANFESNVRTNQITPREDYRGLCWLELLEHQIGRS